MGDNKEAAHESIARDTPVTATSTATRIPYVIFNDQLPKQPQKFSSAVFQKFRLLPPELRVRIWQICASTSRFIQLRVVAPEDENGEVDASKLYTRRNELGNIISDYRYRLQASHITEWQPSALASVCIEARTVFQRICRVRFPVLTADGVGRYIHFCPESDIIRVHGEDSMIALLHDLVAYDPKRVGVAHLAVRPGRFWLKLKPRNVPVPARTAIRKLLRTSLLEIYVMCDLDDSSRGMCGGLHYPRKHIVHLNRSVPLLPESQYYTNIGYDSRPIEADLPNFGSRWDPRLGVYCWNQFQATFGSTRHINKRYLVGMSISGYNSPTEMGTRQELMDCLERFDNWWEEFAPMLGGPWGNVRTKEDYETERVTIPQAVGLWELPLEAFGDIPQTRKEKLDNEWHAWKHTSIRDLSQFHPKLWCFNLY